MAVLFGDIERSTKRVINLRGYIEDFVLWNKDADELKTRVWRTLLQTLGLTVNGEFISFSHILAHLGMSGMERLAGNVGTATGVVRLDTGSSHPFKPFSLIIFAAQLNRRVKLLAHPMSRLGFFDRESTTQTETIGSTSTHSY